MSDRIAIVRPAHSDARLRCRRALAALAGLVLVTAGCAGRAEESSAASAPQAADAALAEIVAEDGGSGVVAAVRMDGELLWSGSEGAADLEAGIALGPEHKLRIGSVSKSLTAVLTLKLVEAGLLDLDAPIQTYVPDYPQGGREVTLRRLLSHTAGVRHYDFANYLEANNVIRHPRLADALEAFRDDPLVAAPGASFHYSSFGFNLIGMAIEAATGDAYGAALERWLSEPLGLGSTRANDPLAIIPGRARFYTVSMRNPMMPWMRDGELINTIFRDDSDLYPSGGLLSSAEDLALFAEAVFAGDFLRPGSRALLTTPASLADGEPVTWSERGVEGSYSLGFGIFRGEEGEVFYGHGGETNGAFALVRYWPERRLSVGAIANFNTVDGQTSFFRLAGQDIPEAFWRARALEKR